jgi:hypothetical protein
MQWRIGNPSPSQACSWTRELEQVRQGRIAWAVLSPLLFADKLTSSPGRFSVLFRLGSRCRNRRVPAVDQRQFQDLWTFSRRFMAQVSPIGLRALIGLCPWRRAQPPSSRTQCTDSLAVTPGSDLSKTLQSAQKLHSTSLTVAVRFVLLCNGLQVSSKREPGKCANWLTSKDVMS